MDNSVRWTVKVSKDTDITLRSYLAKLGLRKGDLSKFIEEAVRWRVFDRTVQNIKERNAEISGDRLQSIINDAVAKVRVGKG